MNEWKDLENPELKQLIAKHLYRGIVFLLLIAVVFFATALAFEEQIRALAVWLNSRYGVLGLIVAVFLSDTLVSPIPPDAALFFIGRSPLHENWFTLVPLLGFVSSCAGVVGWWIGHKLKGLRFFRRYIDIIGKEHMNTAKRFGFWLVVIGALTPLPFSLTCWLAGIFKMPLKTFIIASSFRIPRFIIYYWAIFYSGAVGSLLRNLL